MDKWTICVFIYDALCAMISCKISFIVFFVGQSLRSNVIGFQDNKCPRYHTIHRGAKASVNSLILVLRHLWNKLEAFQSNALSLGWVE